VSVLDDGSGQYTAAWAPARGPWKLEITVERLEDGEVSPYLVGELRPKDKLELRGPIGGYFVWKAEDPRPQYEAAILLDMIAGKRPRFPAEDHSYNWAKPLVQRIWKIARELQCDAFQQKVGDRVRDDHLALPLENVRHTLAAFLASTKAIGPNEKNAMRIGCVGIDADYGDALENRGVNRGLEKLLAHHGNQNARRMQGDGLLKGVQLFLR